MKSSLPIHGRGASHDPPNRFEPLHLEWEEQDSGERPSPATRFYRDRSRHVISTNESPDVPFDSGVNPYRGCEHGCIYCFARPYHEYLGFSAGLDFETRIVVKEEAPARLREALSSPRWTPRPLMLSGSTDPYQPVERKLGITRGVLAVLAEFRNPVSVITKNHLITRDVDILGELAASGAVAVTLSITTLSRRLQGIMEPRTSIPARRLKAVEALASAGIPLGVNVAPVIPGLTDHELPDILRAAADAGARTAGYILLRLPHAVAPLFERWLEQHVPDRREKILSRMRDLHGGRLYDSAYGTRARGGGPYAEQIERLFEVSRAKAGLTGVAPDLSVEAFRRPHTGSQMEMAL